MASNYPTYKLGEIANVLDSFRKPINAAERTRRIQGKEEKDLYPYFGATGQVGYIDEYLTDGEYVLVGEDGAPFLEPFKNKSYIIQGKAWVNNHAHILSGKENVSCNKYLCHFLNSFDYRGYVNGTTRLKLTQGNLVEIPIPLPPLPTQRAIVTRIESLFAELDKGVEKLKTAQQQLKVYRQAVLNDCLTKGSEKWKKVKLGEVIERIEAGKSFRCSEKVPSKNEKGIVKISAVTWGEFLEMECKTIVNEEFYNPNYRIHKGDLLISRANTLQLVGSCVFVRKEPNRDIVLSDKVLRLIPKQNADSRFLLYSLRTSNSRKQIQTMSTGNQDSMRNIGQDRLKKINLGCPSLPEQQRIVQEVETRLSACDEVEKNINESLQQSEALRQSILKKAFSGELV